MTAERIQRKRTRGWRMPEDAIYVGRPGEWGNPFKIGKDADDAAHAVDLYRAWLEVNLSSVLDPYGSAEYRRSMSYYRDRILTRAPLLLRGRDLACWCPLDGPCHADVLLELANADLPEEGTR